MSRGGKSPKAFVRDAPERLVDNFRESVENLLKAVGAEGGQKPVFQSGSGVVLRDAPYLGSRHAASRPEAGRVPKSAPPGDGHAKMHSKTHNRPSPEPARASVFLPNAPAVPLLAADQNPPKPAHSAVSGECFPDSADCGGCRLYICQVWSCYAKIWVAFLL